MGGLIVLALIVIAAIVVGGFVLNVIGALIGWLLIGLIAGYLANYFLKGRASDLIGNLVLGLFGSVVSGILLGITHMGNLDNNFVGSLIFSTLGAMLLIWLGRAIKFGRPSTPRYR